MLLTYGRSRRRRRRIDTALHRNCTIPPQSTHNASSSPPRPNFSETRSKSGRGWDLERLRREVKLAEDGRIQMDLATCSRIFGECCQLQALPEGRRIHECLNRKGLLQTGSLSLGNLVLSFYGKCGSLQESIKVFESLARRDIVSWNAMIAAYAAHGCGKAGLQMYSHIQWECLVPNRITLVSLLNAFSGSQALKDGKLVHLLVHEAGLEQHLIVGSALVNMYSRCGSLEDASKAFSQIANPNVVAWNVIIGAYAQLGNLQASLQLFEQMQRTHVVPDKVTFVILIDACANLADLGRGKWIHAQIVEHKVSFDVVVGNALINMYGKCKSVADALQIFTQMRRKDVVTWNSMIAANARNGCSEAALALFEQMLERGVSPTTITCVSILSACASPPFSTRAKLIHATILKLGFESDVSVMHGLVNMYSKCGDAENALLVFDRMNRRNLVSWNTVIAAYTQHGYFEKALQAFAEMQQEGFKPNKISYVSLLTACCSPETLPVGQCLHAQIVSSNLESDNVVGNALLNMYARCGTVQDAFEVFEKLPNKDVVSWNSMIVAYADHRCEKEALQLFRQLQQQKLAANEVTYASILEVCAKLNDLKEGKQIHTHIAESGLKTDIVVENALVDMYGKCGSMEDAHRTFTKMSRRDLVSWNAIIAACSKQEGIQALQFFGELQMEQVPADHITIVSVLSACSHAGMVTEGGHYFFSISQSELTMEHYGCMVDLLGRAGLLEEADKLVASMPFEPSAALWMSLLGACKLYIDVRRAKRIAYHLLELNPEDPTPFVLLANVFAAAGEWEEFSKLRRKMSGIQLH